MRHLLVLSAVTLTCCWPVRGEQVVREIFWEELKQSGSLLPGEVVTSVPGTSHASHLRIYNVDPKPKTVQVLALDSPGINSVRYCVQGSVLYQNVALGSYLELWNYFPNGGACFSRTLGDSGPMRKLEGSSDWRPFVLPFFSNEDAGSPKRLEVNVVFAGSGSVWLGPLRLVQYDANEDPLAVPGAWWSDRAAGFGGGLAGTVVGCLGGLVGTLTGLGKARRFVLTLVWVMVVAGIASLLAGVVAVSLGQPYAVYYPLLLTGLICSLVFGLGVPTLRRRYEQCELRRMEALDLGGGASSQ